MPAPALSIVQAAHALQAGAVIAYPTEAVWGLGCDPRNENAVMRLLDIKRREIGKGLILIAANVEQLASWVDLSALPAERLTEVLASWPGPHTWILPAGTTAPRWITGDHDGIAVRVSAHPLVQALCAAFGAALVSTSANSAGAPAAKARADLEPGVLAQLDGLVEGNTGGLQRPTPIRDARSGAQLRA